MSRRKRLMGNTQLFSISTIIKWMRETDRPINDGSVYRAAKDGEFITFKSGTKLLASREGVVAWYESKYRPSAEARIAEARKAAAERARAGILKPSSSQVVADEIRSLSDILRGSLVIFADVNELRARIERIEQAFVHVDERLRQMAKDETR